ncbi:MAG: segregation/condensation protein A [Candidatus Eisenbacteria bacterium]|nr:segregation/condensation protein A [Candidatus Eisenbacteria bacterium]
MVSIAEEIRGTGYRVQLEKFEGPLDLLLYLIKRDEIDIYDIPISRIADQYLEHVQMMQMLDLDVAGEFLVMAATLMRIKAKMLLPRPAEDEEEEEEDPREELVRRLLEYRRYKRAAEQLTRDREERRLLVGRTRFMPEEDEEGEEEDPPELQVPVDMVGLLRVFAQLIERAPRIDPYEVILDEYNMEEKAELIERRLGEEEQVEFTSLFGEEPPKQEVIVTFIAVLELLRLQRIRMVQAGLFGRIWIRRRTEVPDGIPAEQQHETGP